MLEERSEHSEIIIVRRHDPGHDDEHHGGVWKIAFADFMTAMMAFFLVMWLINAANEETKKAVASYFTPIKLTDKTSNPKGLNDPKYGQPTSEETEDNDETSTFASGGKLNQKVPDPVQVKEQALFTDPYAVLSEIAGGMVSGEAKPGKQPEVDGKKNGLGTTGGDAFHDPFDPSSWNTELGLKDKAAATDEPRIATNGMNSDVGQAARDKAGDGGPDSTAPENADPQMAGKPASSSKAEANQPSAKQQVPGEAAETNHPPGLGLKPAGDSTGLAEEQVARQEAAKQKPAGDTGTRQAEAKAETESKTKVDGAQAHTEANQKLAENIRGALGKLIAHRNMQGPNIEVVADGSGVMISVADEFKFGMFDIGSTVPRPETVNAMAEIGKLLAKTPGQVTVAGHTDARKFSGGNYDNWRLSTDRANIARYMLIRGGLDESRFERVEGFAASRPKIPDDPLAAANRRIEIYVRLP